MSIVIPAMGTTISKARFATTVWVNAVTAVATIAAVANPTPPIVGVAVECHLSDRGGIIAKPRKPIRRTMAQSPNERLAATKAEMRAEVNMEW
jgi:hypothetical protein